MSNVCASETASDRERERGVERAVCKLLIIYGRPFTFPIAATCWAINLHFIDMHTHTRPERGNDRVRQRVRERERERATIETVREFARFAIFV